MSLPSQPGLAIEEQPIASAPSFSRQLESALQPGHLRCWWKHGVIYQIYPRSFQDSNGDGIGDIPGIIQRLDYLNNGSTDSLGVDAIWLSPIYPSPLADFGYDISDYCAIAPEFGTLEDFDRLLHESHHRGIRVILDLVVNHTSDQHPWFEASCRSDSDKQDWYIWHEGKTRPNNWQSCFGGTGWTFNQERQAWYFHSFLPQQPDLNWRNPAVKQAIFDVMRFWLDRGVDGFRLDVANFYFKDAELRNNPVNHLKIARPYDRQMHQWDRDQPELHDLFRDMRKLVDEYPERMLVGEILTPWAEAATLASSYQGEDDELNLAFNFQFLHSRFSAPSFKRAITHWMEHLGADNWPTFTLGNHDVKRMASRYAAGRNTTKRLKLLATMLMTLRGTPFLYYGDELGMPEQRMPKAKLKDPAGIRYWPLYPGRDGCRRPMMWSSNPEDFSEAEGWLASEPIAENSYSEQDQQPGSLLDWYRQLIHWRNHETVLHSGGFRMVNSATDVLAYVRTDRKDRLLILLNFSDKTQTTELSSQRLGPCRLCNLGLGPVIEHKKLVLQPLQALVIQVPDDVGMVVRV